MCSFFWSRNYCLWLLIMALEKSKSKLKNEIQRNISGTKSQIWKHLEWTGNRKGNRLPGHWPGPGCMQETGCIPAIPNSSLLYHDIIIQTHAHWTKATWRHNDRVNFMPGYRIIVKLQLKMAVNFFYKGFHVTGWLTWYKICIICQNNQFIWHSKTLFI